MQLDRASRRRARCGRRAARRRRPTRRGRARARRGSRSARRCVPAGATGPRGTSATRSSSAGQAGVVEDDLHRAARQADVERRPARAAPVTATASGKPGRLAPRRRAAARCGGVGRRREVGDAGDAEARPARPPRRATSGGRAADALAQHVVHPVQPAGRPPASSRSIPSPRQRLDAGPAQGRAVEHPQLPGAVLHADRAVGDERVEAVAVERTGDRLVVADGAHPVAARAPLAQARRARPAADVDRLRAPRPSPAGGRGGRGARAAAPPPAASTTTSAPRRRRHRRG